MTIIPSLELSAIYALICSGLWLADKTYKNLEAKRKGYVR